MRLLQISILALGLFSAHVFAAAPSAISNLSVETSLDDRSAYFTWDQNPLDENIIGYKFYIGLEPETWLEPDGKSIGLVTDLQNRDLHPSKTYYYGFSAYNADGESPVTTLEVSLTGDRPYIFPIPNGGLFVDPVTVRFDLPDTYLLAYTLDGSDPTDEENFRSIQQYDGPFRISKSASLQYFVTEIGTDYFQDVNSVAFTIDSSSLAEEADRALFEGLESGVSVNDIARSNTDYEMQITDEVSSMRLGSRRLTVGHDSTISVLVSGPDNLQISDNTSVTLNVLMQGDRSTSTFGSVTKNGVATFTVPGSTIGSGSYDVWAFSQGIQSDVVSITATAPGQLDETGTGLNLLILLTVLIGGGAVYRVYRLA